MALTRIPQYGIATKKKDEREKKHPNLRPPTNGLNGDYMKKATTERLKALVEILNELQNEWCVKSQELRATSKLRNPANVSLGAEEDWEIKIDYGCTPDVKIAIFAVLEAFTLCVTSTGYHEITAY